VTGRGLFRPRLLLRVYLYGVLMLALAGAASFLVGKYVITPAVEHPARPSTAWICWHLLSIVGEPERLRTELADLKQRTRVEVTLFDAEGAILAGNAERTPAPLTASELERLKLHGTAFAAGSGAVAQLAPSGKVERYARVTYPVPEPPLGSGVAQLLAALAVLALLSIPLASSISAPLERLGELARALGSGDLSARSGLRSSDEIGQLAHAFDEMADSVVSLRRTERELLANVSHELRTPLARIRMALDLVREGDTARAAGYVDDIGEDLEELERMLDDVLTAARLDLAGDTAAERLPTLRRKLLPAAELVEAARTRFEKRLPERKLELQLGPELPELDADASLLRRVLDNLLDNAAKYSEPDTSIELVAQRSSDGRSLVIEVKDHGVGIPESDLPRLFEPFFRGDRSRTRATGGVGLGLTLSRRIVEAHGGTITARSEPDQGTSFRVAVPAVQRGPGTATPS
jgi:signal transduction histidine kinase